MNDPFNRYRVAPHPSSSKKHGKAPHSPSGHANEEGFALVDVLVGLALASVLSALMMTFLGQARTIGRLNSNAQIQTELEAVANYIEATIAAAEPVPLEGGETSKHDYLQGADGRVRLSTIRPIGFEKAGLQELTLSISVAAENGGQLEMITRPRFGFADADQRPEPIILLAGVENFKLEYLQSRSSSGWIESWNRPGYLPLAIRFTISTRKDGKLFHASGLATLSLAKSGATGDGL